MFFFGKHALKVTTMRTVPKTVRFRKNTPVAVCIMFTQKINKQPWLG